MRLLDLFCGAGGAAKGYADAGFDVVGVDIIDQPNYPYEFHQADALDVLHVMTDGWSPDSPVKPVRWGQTFDAIHASPPCQAYSAMSTCRPEIADKYPRLIGAVRHLFNLSGLPYVIENVEGAPLIRPSLLCGQMFGLELYRHRLFEASFPLPWIGHPEHTIPASRAGHWTPGTIMSVAGHIVPIAHARKIMGIDWTTREELAEAIPPAYTEWVGKALMAHLKSEAAA